MLVSFTSKTACHWLQSPFTCGAARRCTTVKRNFCRHTWIFQVWCYRFETSTLAIEKSSRILKHQPRRSGDLIKQNSAFVLLAHPGRNQERKKRLKTSPKYKTRFAVYRTNISPKPENFLRIFYLAEWPQKTSKSQKSDYFGYRCQTV